MPGTILVGTQWGDEGKGKVTDLIARDYDFVVRFQGGNNAGHTVIHGDTKLALHLIPSGIMYDAVTPVIGNGCVVDPHVLVDEMDMLESKGIATDKLRISGNAHVIMPYHLDLDGADEARLGKNKIGTTKRGIGPCYQDKFARYGIRVQDLLDEHILREKLAAALSVKNDILEKVYGLPGYTVDGICDEYLPFAARLRPHVIDASQTLNEALRGGKRVLFEGAQATQLDIDHGTYPFATSSNCTAGGACTGGGVGPVAIERVVGVAKAYLTRVGAGPFPTELFDEDGARLAELGCEVGVTTGRARRTGWYDAVVVRYAAEVNGLTDIALTKLDVLGSFETIKVCTAYEADGRNWASVPGQQTAFHHAKPVYEELPGWNCDISGCRSFDELPKEARDYVAFLEKLAGVRVSIVTVGPERDQTILRGWED
jgi:adenylosuccinate synthase